MEFSSFVIDVLHLPNSIAIFRFFVVSNCQFSLLVSSPSFAILMSFSWLLPFVSFSLIFSCFSFLFSNKSQSSAPHKIYQSISVWFDCLTRFLSCSHYSVELSKLKNCIIYVMKVCVEDSLEESQVREIIDQAVTEEKHCLDGSMEIPTMPPTDGSICPASFSSDADTCLRSFHQKFAKDKSDAALCS